MRNGQWLRVLVAVSIGGPVVLADSFSWLPSNGTNSFQATENWDKGSVPGAADSVTFGIAGTYGVSFAEDAQNTLATVGASGARDVAFVLAGRTWRLGNLSFSGSTTARFGGGLLDVFGWPTVGANQRLSLEAGSCSFGGLSTTSSGAIEVLGGDHSVSNGMGLAPTTAGGVSFRITNGVFWVRAINNARFVLNEGAATETTEVRVEGGTLKLGNLDVYQGNLNVFTNGTCLTSAASIGRGTRKIGTVNIYGGTVSNYTGNALSVGMGTLYLPATGVVNLADGILHNSAGINLGGSSDGRTTNSVGLLKVSGGRLFLNGTCSVGGNTGTLGVYTQSAGTAWCNSILLGNGGTGARGELYLSGGTLALAASPYLGNAATCTGVLYQTGGDLVISNSVVVGGAVNSAGFFRQEEGNSLVNGNVHVGNASGAYGYYRYGGGLATVNGSVRIGNASGASGKAIVDGSALYVRDDWVVGAAVSATGELEIAGGTLVRPGGMSIGSYAGSLGTVRISGGELISSNSVTLGTTGGARGELHLSAGAFYSRSISDMCMSVGNVGGSTGVLVVTGGRLVMTNKYSLFAGSTAGAFGSVLISGGTNEIGSLRIGHSGGTGFLRIDGGRTYVTNDVNFLFAFGNALESSTGRLELAGGVLTTRSVFGNTGYATALFDGGVLQCSKNSWDPFVYGFDQATLTERGLVLDSDGRTTTLSQTFSNEPGFAGRCAKRGEGKVTLTSSSNTFTGLVKVEQGELAVSGTIYLTGGVAIDAGAVLNLSAGTVRDAMTGAGTTSRVDGALCLASGGVLTNGVGSVFSGSGVVTGGVTFAAGSVWAQDEVLYAGPLKVTGMMSFEQGAVVSLTGYSVEELSSGIALAQAVGAGSFRLSGKIPVTLNGASHPYWWANVSNDGQTLTARVIPRGTFLSLF